MSSKNTEIIQNDSGKVNLTPNWLTEVFIEGHLKNHYKNNQLKITSFEAKPNSIAGIGYLSSMYRVNVTVNIPAINGCSNGDQVSYTRSYIFFSIWLNFNFKFQESRAKFDDKSGYC